MSKTAGFDQFTRLYRQPLVLALAVTGAGAAYVQTHGTSTSMAGPVRADTLPTKLPLPAFPRVAQDVAPQPVAAPDVSASGHEAAIGDGETQPAATPRPTTVLPQPAFGPAADPVSTTDAARTPPGGQAISFFVARLDDAAQEDFVPAYAESPAAASIPLHEAVPAAPAHAPLAEAPAAVAGSLAGEGAPAPARADIVVAAPSFDATPTALADLAGTPAVEPGPMAALDAGAQPDLSALARAETAPQSPAPVAPQATTGEPRRALAMAAPEASPTTAASQTAEWTSRIPGADKWTLRDQRETYAAAQPTRNGSAAFRDAPPSARKHRLTGRGIEFAIPVVMEGQQPAWVPMLIDGEQNVSVKLGDLLMLVRPMLPERTYQWLSGSDSAQEFMTLRELRSRGLDLRYDAARNRLVMSDIGASRGEGKHRFALSLDQ